MPSEWFNEETAPKAKVEMRCSICKEVATGMVVFHPKVGSKLGLHSSVCSYCYSRVNYSSWAPCDCPELEGVEYERKQVE